MLSQARRIVRAIANRLRGKSSQPAPQPTVQPGLDPTGLPCKACADNVPGRFREIISDPLNLLIARDARAGVVEGDNVYLHNGNIVAYSGPMSYYGDFSEILIINRGVHEPAEEFIFQELLKALRPDPVMLELGSYWGHYSMWMKKKFPNATLYMVEPDSRNIAVGRHNFALNRHEGEFIQALVGQGHFAVDQFLESRALRRLDVLHSDIQGFEMEMLDGADRSLRQKSIDYVVISTHSDQLHRAVHERLTSHGYVVEAASDVETETTSFDGLVFARSPSSAPIILARRIVGRRDIVASSPTQLLDYLQDLASMRGRQT